MSDVDPPADECATPNAVVLWGHAYDASRDCIDTETHIEAGCVLLPGEGEADDHLSDGFACLRRLVDQQDFWVFASRRVGFDPKVWDRCEAAPILPPKGCYAAECPSAPRSTCSLEETKRLFACGGRSEFDENCCGRAPCALPEDCASDEQCGYATSLGQIDCWDNGPCDCGGAFGGPNKMLCLPEPSPDACTIPDADGRCPADLVLFDGRRIDQKRHCVAPAAGVVCSADEHIPFDACWVDVASAEPILLRGSPCLPAGRRYRYCTTEESSALERDLPPCE